MMIFHVDDCCMLVSHTGLFVWKCLLNRIHGDITKYFIEMEPNYYNPSTLFDYFLLIFNILRSLAVFLLLPQQNDHLLFLLESFMLCWRRTWLSLQLVCKVKCLSSARSRQSAVALALCPLQLAALNGREEARGAARRSETIRIPVGVDRLQSSATPGRSPPSG